MGRDRYIEQFLKNLSYPSNVNLKQYLSIGTFEELNSLLSYIWNRNRVLELINREITIEVFIGGKDKIVNSIDSFNFFSNITTTYLLKNLGHILR